MKKNTNFADASTAALNKFFHSNEENQKTTSQENNADSDQQEDVKPKPIVVQKKYIDKYRMTLVLDDESKMYLDVMTRLEGRSITQYINDLIAADAEKHKDEFLMAAKLFKIKV